jgi:hypothetical protein
MWGFLFFVFCCVVTKELLQKEDPLNQNIQLFWIDFFFSDFINNPESRVKNLKRRLEEFGLSLHPDKTRLIEFGKFADENRRKRGSGKPETFDFLGFTHMCAKTRVKKRFLVWRKTVKKRLRAALSKVKLALKVRMHDEIEDVGLWLRNVITGYNQYYAIPGNFDALNTYRTRLPAIGCRC